MDTRNINSLVLAYLGDSVYENYVREYLIKEGFSKVNDLQIAAIKYVSAKNQTEILKKLMDANTFTTDELEVIKRARNTKINTHPKNCDIMTYHHATSFEALFGYLKLENKNERIEEIINKILC